MIIKSLILSIFFSLVFLFPSYSKNNTNDVCKYQTSILELSDLIIDERENLSVFSKRKYGTTATYIKIRYSDMKQEEIISVLDNIIHTKNINAEELAMAFNISKLGINEYFLNPQEAYSKLGNYYLSPSILRAVILHDNDKFFLEYYELYKSLQEAKIHESIAFSAIISILDQSDDFKQKFADLALENQHEILSALILSSKLDLEKFYSLIRTRHGLPNLEDLMQNNFILLKDHKNQPNVFKNKLQHLQRLWLLQQKIDDIKLYYDSQIKLFSLIDEELGTAYIYSIMNFSGQVAPLLEAVIDVNEHFFNNTNNFDKSIEYRRKIVFEKLMEKLNDSSLFNFPIDHERHYSNNLLDLFEWSTAIAVLQPFINNEIQNIPERPQILSEHFDWQGMVDVAEAFVLNNKSQLKILAKQKPTIYLEFLYQRDQMAGLVSYIKKKQDIKEKVNLAKEFMLRLDMRCKRLTYFPVKDVLHSFDAIYKFPKYEMSLAD